jgi:hypothetical protein
MMANASGTNYLFNSTNNTTTTTTTTTSNPNLLNSHLQLGHHFGSAYNNTVDTNGAKKVSSLRSTFDYHDKEGKTSNKIITNKASGRSHKPN